MSLKKLAVLSALTLTLLLGPMMLGPARTQAAGPWYVAPTGNDGNNCLSPATACLTLQAAINKASAGDTINVAAGTYTVVGVVAVNKSLTLKGAQSGIDARTRSGAESILQNSGGLYVTANDVITNGFTVQNSTVSAFTGYGIDLGAGTSGGQVINNIIQNNIAGVGLANNPAGSQAVIQYNLFRNNTQPGGASGTGIYSDEFVAGFGIGVSNVLIDSNDFVNDNGAVTNTWGIGISNTDPAHPFVNLNVQNNKFASSSPASRGMYFYGTHSSSIKANLIANKTNYAIGLFDDDAGITIQCNTIQNSNRGVWVDFVVVANSNFTINDNNISGNATAGVVVELGSYSGGPGSLNAKNNWWGSSTGPTIASNPGGSGDTILDLNGVVNYRPFLTSAQGLPCPTPPTKEQCEKAVEQQEKAFETQQKVDKKAFDAQLHTKAEKKAFEEQQEAARKAFNKQHEADEKRCDQLPGGDTDDKDNKKDKDDKKDKGDKDHKDGK